MTPSAYKPSQGYKESKAVGVNNWKASGIVLKKNIKATESGAVILNLLLEVPAKNPKYNTKLWLKAFNSTKSPDKNIADQINNAVQEGEKWHFTGSFNSSERLTKDKKPYLAEDKVIWKFEPATEEEKTDDQPF
jgi:hypothetical protein